jgi:hypothetical protein
MYFFWIIKEDYFVTGGKFNEVICLSEYFFTPLIIADKEFEVLFLLTLDHVSTASLVKICGRTKADDAVVLQPLPLAPLMSIAT